MIRIAAWVSAGLGALICMLGAAFIVGSQAAPAEESIFPLPGLILIGWAVIGVLGFISSIAALNPQYPHLGRAVWIMVGALLPLMVLTALSIGPPGPGIRAVFSCICNHGGNAYQDRAIV